MQIFSRYILIWFECRFDSSCAIRFITALGFSYKYISIVTFTFYCVVIALFVNEVMDLLYDVSYFSGRRFRYTFYLSRPLLRWPLVNFIKEEWLISCCLETIGSYQSSVIVGRLMFYSFWSKSWALFENTSYCSRYGGAILAIRHVWNCLILSWESI